MSDFNRKTAASENLEDKFLIMWQDANEGYSLDFVVLEIEGIEVSPNPGPYFASAVANDVTNSVDEAKSFMDGFIKWDGCSNWSMNTGDHMMHMCGYRDAQKFARLIPRMYEIARDNMPKFDRQCADMEVT